MANKQWKSPPAMQIDPAKSYSATMHTDQGDIVIDLFAADAPQTVNNFVFLAKEGFYDGVGFHRVISGFMAQGGDPTGTGMGGPGYKFKDEINANKHQAGSLSMANAGPNTNGSQFFLCFAPQPHLDPRHTVFGKVQEGSMSVVNAIPPRDPNQRSAPMVTITGIDIEEK